MSPKVILKGHREQVTSMDASTDTLISASEDGQCRIHDLNSMKCSKAIKLQNGISSCILRSQTVYIASDNQIMLFDIREPGYVISKPSLVLYEASDEINSISMHENGNFLAFADDAGKVEVVDLRNNAIFKRFRSCHGNFATCVDFRPKNSWQLFSGSFDTKAIQWDFSKGFAMNEFSYTSHETPGFNPPYVFSLKCSPDGKRCIIGRGNGSIQCMNAKKNSNRKEFWEETNTDAHGWSVTALDFDSENCVISGSLDQTFAKWEITDNGMSCLKRVNVPGIKINAIKCIGSIETDLVAVAGYSDDKNGDIYVYQVR